MKRPGEELWKAPEGRLLGSSLWKFKEFCERELGCHFKNYTELHTYSIAELERFWGLAEKFLHITWSERPSHVLTPSHNQGMLGYQWFAGGRLSFVENLLGNSSPDSERIISIVEGVSEPVRLTQRELLGQVAQCTAALKALGIVSGDRIAGICTNSTEAIIAMLASSSLGAIWSSCSPDFGAAAILDRLSQLSPKVLFLTNSYVYNGKLIECMDTMRTVVKQIPSLVATVKIDPLSRDEQQDSPEHWLGFLAQYPRERALLNFAPVATRFDHPLYILFSSGTTGKPKCIVHSVGGTLLQHKKELQLHCDLGPGKKLLYFTTCGWMMWNWMVSALACGSTLILFEGSVQQEGLGVLWRALEEHGVHCFGTSPKFLSACMKENLQPSARYKFPKLETLLSTGSPLLPEHFDWVYQKVKSDVHLASISGGTDIISCFMLGNLWQSVNRGEIQGPGLGMAVESWRDGRVAAEGERGELVCSRPFPSMPIGFWGDDGSKYRETYFASSAEREVWWHGDYIEQLANGGFVVLGRADATLNPGGVRIGTAEIYRQVDCFSEVSDSLAVSYMQRGEASVLLFVKLSPGVTLTQQLIAQIKQSLRSGLSPRHVPDRIIQVGDIPYTRSGKKLEIAVTRLLAGESIDNLGSIANPECLDEYRAFPSLKSENLHTSS